MQVFLLLVLHLFHNRARGRCPSKSKQQRLLLFLKENDLSLTIPDL